MNTYHQRRNQLTILALVSVGLLTQSPLARACPFCSVASQTLSEELAAAEAAVIVKLVKAAPSVALNADDSASLGAANPDTGMAQFAIEEVILGKEKIGDLEQIEVVYFGENEADKSFLISGIAGEPIDWTTPLPLSARAVEYVKHLGELPEKGPDRLSFFLGHLEDEDPLLGQDAYDEFARAPYDEISAMADRLDRQQLTRWIEDPDVGPTRRRLYLTLLGVCGGEEDIAMLEALLRYDYQQMKPGIAAMVSLMGIHGSAIGTTLVDELTRADVRRKRQCLDALIAAYLKLKGPEGLPLIEEQFLSNPSAEYTHVYATIMALRFHGEESKEIPIERLQQSLRLVLDNHEIADQVIPDLARWEDWTILDRLVSMFKDSEKDAWIRQPVISYLLTAGELSGDVGTRANEAIVELEALDPKGVKRARSYMAFGLLARAGAKPKAKPDTEANAKLDTKANSEASAKTIDETLAEQPGARETTETPAAVAGSSAAETVAAVVEKEEAEIVESTPQPSRLAIVGIPLLAGLVLMGVFAILLRGSHVHSSSKRS